MAAAESTPEIVRESELPGLNLVRRGKVRDLYDLGDRYLIVATDRISAFDFILPGGIPEKGRVLTQLSLFWFDLLGTDHHLISADVDDLPESCAPYRDVLRGRFMIVEKLEIQPVECIVRGYLAGSGFAEYKKQGTVCGLPLPEGLVESSQLPETVYTPSTKAEQGEHDENIPFETTVEILGQARAEELREKSLAVYGKAAEWARARGIIIADTKFEWGVRPNGELVLADEVLTPDSSRFWPADLYVPGKSQPSFDKQYVRDWLLGSAWNRQPPVPELPDEVVAETSRKYREIYEKLTGKSWNVD